MADGMDLSLQKAIVAVLSADADMILMIGDRLYEEVPEEPGFPYVTIGDTQDLDDSVQDQDASEMFVDVHVWSTATGYEECKRIAARVRRLIHDSDLSLDEDRCVLINHRITRTFTDVDPTTKHSVVTFRALTEVTT